MPRFRSHSPLPAVLVTLALAVAGALIIAMLVIGMREDIRDPGRTMQPAATPAR